MLEPEEDGQELLDHGEEARFQAEVKRIHGRYVVEVVERFGFCPWAERARREGRSVTHVVLGADSDSLFARSWDQFKALPWKGDAGALEVCFFVFPQAFAEFHALAGFAEAFRAKCSQASEEAFAVAEFHPRGTAQRRTAAGVVPLLRRSPDPTLQVIPMSLIARVASGSEGELRVAKPSMLAATSLNAGPLLSPREQLAQRNLAVLQQERDAIERAIEKIRLEQRAAYRSLGRAPVA